MDPYAAVAPLLFVAFFAWLALRSDSSPQRLCGLAVDGQPVDGSRIVKVRAHLNGRCGLLNHAALGPRDGLFFSGSKAVHTHGMLFSIDIVFLDPALRVLAVHTAAPPGRTKIRGPRGTYAVLELAATAARREFALEPGKVVRLGL